MPYRKEGLTSFDVAAVVCELKNTVQDSRVNNIYQPNIKTILFKLRKTDKPVFWLVLEAGRRLHLTAYTIEKPLVPTAFCMALRKFLRNAWLTGIAQHELDRIVILSFKTRFGVRRLVLELFREGNLILVDENWRILHALSYKRMRDRDILRGVVFKFAPSRGRNPFKLDEETFLEELKAFGDIEVVRAITRFLSVGGFYSEEILLSFDSLRCLLTQVESCALEPYVVLNEADRLVDAIPLKLNRFVDETVILQPFSNFNKAIDEFYSRVSTVEQAVGRLKVDEMRSEAERLKRIVNEQKKTAAQAKAEAERDKHVGDAIYAHIGELQVLSNKFLTGKKKGKEWKTIVAEVLADKQSDLMPWVFFESFDSRNLIMKVRVDGLGFSLRMRRTLYEDAAEFYKRGKLASRKMKGAEAAMNDSCRRLRTIETNIRQARALERIKPTEVVKELAKRKVKKKQWFEKFRWFVSSDDFLITAGRDAVSNEVLIKKYTNDEDLVLHADIVGAPFVVIKTDGRKPSEQCILEAATFAASYSRGWREGFGSVDVYWVEPGQLNKGASSGESVGRGAFVVRGGRNWLRGVELKLGIGVVIGTDGAVQFVGGPIEALQAKTKAFVTVMPGDRAGKDLLKLILSTLAPKMPEKEREKVLRASIEEVREFVPYSKGRISKS
jgi:predicted ribosome quality control (RQC) complex YloA/Tae2 family protein